MTEEEKERATTPPAAEGEQKPRGRKFGCLHVFFGALVLLLLAIGCWSWWLHGARKEFLRHAEPLVREVEDEWPTVPESENALPLYWQAFGLIPNPGVSSVLQIESRTLDFLQIVDVNPEFVANFLKDNEPHLQALRKAQERPGCARKLSLQEKYAFSRAIVPGEGCGFSYAARFLTASARVRSREGKPQEAAERLAMSLRISRDVRRLRGGCSRVFQVEIESNTARAIQAVLGDCDFDSSTVESLLSAVEHHHAEWGSLEAALNEERALGIATVYAPLVTGRLSANDLLGPSNLREKIKVGFWEKSGFAIRDARYYDQTMLRIIAASKKPCAEAVAEARRLGEELAKSPGWWAMASRGHLYIPDTASFIIRDADANTWLRLSRLGLALRLHKLKSGAYPEKLSELSAKFPERFKELPADPFTGKEMLYRRTEKGCLVWSVGEDRKDDGGDAKKDIVFELTR